MLLSTQGRPESMGTCIVTVQSLIVGQSVNGWIGASEAVIFVWIEEICCHSDVIVSLGVV